ncbi:MAG TPA: PD-(D/E)XK nuclease family protein [Vicinamibacterales bacterium]|nr:PD-(D/E)XK nuclease family protein [Vicinamibacterales bacterium]
MNPVHVIESSSATLRLSAARAFVEPHVGVRSVLMIGASRGAVDDLAREVARRQPATMGLHRFGFAQLAARLAAPVLAARGIAPATWLGSEAVAARATFDAQRGGELGYFGPVAPTPGFPRALARTIQELRLSAVAPSRIGSLPLGGRDLEALLARFERLFAEADATDRAALFSAAAEGAALPSHELAGAPLLLLDVPLDSEVEFAFCAAVLRAAGSALVTVPFGDVPALERLRELNLDAEVLEPKGGSDLDALRRYLFAGSRPPDRRLAGDVRLFSAPGEGRECVEILRRVLEEAARGVPFDEMAVLLRSPQQYLGLLEHAFRRAGVAAWFDRGIRRPHPAGRAFLAILRCAVEKLSARRFAEYLSLAQVPQLDADAERVPPFVPSIDDAFGPVAEAAAAVRDAEPLPPEEGSGSASLPEPDPDGVAVVDGSLRAPWKWETLIVESSVIGGGAARWHRRLDGLAREYRLKLREERREDPDSPTVQRLQRDLRNLAHLRAFALPIVDRLASWPAAATWGEWLERFRALAPVVLRRPDGVQRILAELEPMSEIGPVTLEEAADVLADRLLTLQPEPPRSRHGAVFVGSPHQARGRTFRVVFVPGLAERMFPQKLREDPLLPDEELREPIDAGLATQDGRARNERLLLRLAVGAATERLWLSYPRLEITESRPRVPSFYVLDVMRAMTGRIPDHEQLQQAAADEGDTSLAWPAPADPGRAIDDLEHDLAVLRSLMAVEPRASVRGHANYMLRLNENLRRSVSARWARGRSAWMPHDGLVRVTGATKPALDEQRLTARPYSLSALQRFSSCPYQFLLSAIYRLEPSREPEPLQRLDPLTRGAIFHEIQARLFRRLRDLGALPVTNDTVGTALDVLDAVMRDVEARQYEDLAPAIDRVWRDEMGSIARDLRVWVRRLPEFQDWEPAFFELSFGLQRDEDHDARSVADPVIVGDRFRLRGSVDLVERANDRAVLRVTDHKTGKNRTTDRTVIGGGGILQPVLYSLAVEQVLGLPVAYGRLFYCTAAGGFTDHAIAINDTNRRSGLEALEIVDRAIELGFLPPAPSRGACGWCDFRPVCGPHEEQRVSRKAAERLADLEALRSRP